MRRALLALLLCAAAWLAGPRATGGPEPGRLRGVVEDPGGRPLGDVEVWVRPARAGCLIVPGRSWTRAVTDAGGAFDLLAPAGGAELLLCHPDYGSRAVAESAADRIRLSPPAWLEGEIGAPAEVVVTDGIHACARVETRGAFRCGPLPPETWLTVTVHSPRHRSFVRRLRLAPGETAHLDVPLCEGLAVEGRVFPPRAGVVLRASQGEARESVATSQSDGTFTLSGLREGPVRVVAIDADRPLRIVDGAAGESLEVRWER